MNERFNSQEEFNVFLHSDEFADGFKQYLISLIEEHQTEITLFFENVAAVGEGIAATLQSQVKALAQAIPPDTVGFIQSLLSAFTASPEELLARWKAIAELGWFPHPSILVGSELITDAISKDSGAVERLLINIFRDELTSIESELIDLYPKRQHLLRQGFEAHRQQQYGLSILMFLAQADGIANDKLSKSVFMKRQREEIPGSDEIPEQPAAIPSAFRLLFKEDTLPIWVSENNRSSTFCGFNRHQVMHGESINYDSEENSLKAVSFLCWLACALYLMEQEVPMKSRSGGAARPQEKDR